MTGWHRNHVRKALASARKPTVVRARRPGAPVRGGRGGGAAVLLGGARGADRRAARAERHASVSAEDKAILNDVHIGLNPAAIQRQVQALTGQLLTLTTRKAAARRTPAVGATAPRASAGESTTVATRAS